MSALGLDLIVDAGPSCRICGCTDDDCSGCSERTGTACSWVEFDLCSACVDVAILEELDARIAALESARDQIGGRS